MELTILMPCLNEAETLATCIDKAQSFLERSGIDGEVLIADNGSTDGSIDIAQDHGARVVHVPTKGYGAALGYGIAQAQGDFVIMGDSDDSYDFSRLEAFVGALRQGADLVMGNRFKGGIAKGAMPFLHRYLGNPVLSFIGRLFFRIPVGDFHCGLRGFRRDSILKLNLETSGMEFASEMVVKAALARLEIVEVPTTLSQDGRSRPPHLRTWRDGWRHLRFLLLFSPRWLFFYPGLVLFGLGLITAFAVAFGPVHVSNHVTLDIHSAIAGCMAMLVGAQCISFAVIARRYATSVGLLPPSETNLEKLRVPFHLETSLLVAAVLALLGLSGVVYSIHVWVGRDFGPLPYGELVRVLMYSCTAVAMGLQIAFTSFLSALLDIKPRRDVSVM